jgi:uncharacterized protein
MRLVLDNDPEILTVQRYGAGEIQVAGSLVRAPCILSPTRLIQGWAARTLATLDLAALEPLLQLAPQIILLGSDEPGARVSGALRRAMEARRIALEAMDVGAACRTYNVLAQERREVVAGLLL